MVWLSGLCDRSKIINISSNPALFIMQLSNRFGGDQEVSANADAQEFEKIALTNPKDGWHLFSAH